MRQRREKVKFRLKGKEVVEGMGLTRFQKFFSIFEKKYLGGKFNDQKLDTKFNDQNFGHQLIQPNVDTHVLLTSEF